MCILTKPILELLSFCLTISRLRIDLNHEEEDYLIMFLHIQNKTSDILFFLYRCLPNILQFMMLLYVFGLYVVVFFLFVILYRSYLFYI